jgi:hypothetical protein
MFRVFRIIRILLIVAFILFGGNISKANAEVKIWNTGLNSTSTCNVKLNSSACNVSPWSNRASWVQITSTGIYTGGDVVVENGKIAVFFHSSDISPRLYGIYNNDITDFGAEMYGEMSKTNVFDSTREWNKAGRTPNIVIIENTANKVILTVDKGNTPGDNIIKYIFTSDSNYVEIGPANDYLYRMGIHFTAGQFGVIPRKTVSPVSADFVMDKAYYPDGTHYVSDFVSDFGVYQNMMIQEVANFLPGRQQYILIYKDPASSRPLFYTDAVQTQFHSMRVETKNDRLSDAVFFGVESEPNTIYHQNGISVPLTANVPYTFNPAPYPIVKGLWRISGRVNGVYYTNNVTDVDNIQFVSPVSGTLQALELYLYDKTAETPMSVTTPMDVYREADGASAGNIKLYDAKVTTATGYQLASTAAWTNKSNWYQVPYGTTSYTFIGDAIIDNGEYWVRFPYLSGSRPDMYGNIGGTPAAHLEMYGTYAVGASTIWNTWQNLNNAIKINENSAGKVSITITGGTAANINKITYISKAGIGSLELVPETAEEYTFAVHATDYIGTVPPNSGSGNDIVLDPALYTLPPKGYGGLAGFGDGINSFNFPAGFFDLNHNNILLQERTRFYNDGNIYALIPKGPDIARSYMTICNLTDCGGATFTVGTMRTHAKQGTVNDRVYFGSVNARNAFVTLKPMSPMAINDVYTNPISTIAGKWRITARLNTGSETAPVLKYYTQQISIPDEIYKFIAPEAGKLQAITAYLYDRTSVTLASIKTPMDLYREALGLAGATIDSPVFSPPLGTYTSTQFVSLSTSTAGATIHYTTNGSTPTESSPTYTSPISVSISTTIKAGAWKTGMIPSSIATAVYTIDATPTPTPSANLLINPGFESGTSSWTFYTNGTGSYTAISPGYELVKAAKISLNTLGTNMQLYQSGIYLEPNASYRLTFSAYSSTGHDFKINLFKDASPYTNYGLSYTPNLTTAWQTFTQDFTTSGFTGNVSDTRFQVYFPGLATAGDIYYLDDFKLEKVTPSVADLNSDSVVNSVDFGIMMSYWNYTTKPKADINQDGFVNSQDLGMLMSQWG